MSKPSKHRRLVLCSDCCAPTTSPSGRVTRNWQPQNKFSFYRGVIERDDEGVGLRSPLDMTWECIQQFYVAPLLQAMRSEGFGVAAFDPTEAAHLHGFLILVLSALTTAVIQGNSDLQLGYRTSHCNDISELLQLLDQLHLHLGTINAEPSHDVASAADDFTTVLKFCLAVNSLWQRDDDCDRISEGNGQNEVVSNRRDWFQRLGAALLQRMASSAIISALQIPHAERGNAKDLVRYWCLAILSWGGRPASVCHKKRCRLILQQFVLGHVEPDAPGAGPLNGLAVGPYIDGAIAVIQECIDEGQQLRTCEFNLLAFERQQEDGVFSTLFGLFIGNSSVPAYCDFVHNMLTKLRVPSLRADYDVAVCLCLIAKHVNSNKLDDNTSPDFVRALFESLASTLITSENEETEQSAMVTRMSVLGIDFLLRSTKWSNFLAESVLHEKSPEAVKMRAIVTVLVQLVLTPPCPSQRYFMATSNLDLEFLLYSELRDSPEVAAARVLVAYLKVALEECPGITASSSNSTDPHLSRGELPPEADDIPLNDAVNICLVLMDSKNHHVVEVVLSSFLCRLWQRDEAVGRAILIKRPDILSSMASVVTRMSDNPVVGRTLAKDVSESWLSLCTCPEDNFRSWMGYVFVRQEAALSALVSLCHDPETSRAALQTVLALSEEISNHRLLARQPGLLTTLIRLVRDGVAPPMHGDGPDSSQILDRETIKQRILVLAEVL